MAESNTDILDASMLERMAKLLEEIDSAQSPAQRFKEEVQSSDLSIDGDEFNRIVSEYAEYSTVIRITHIVLDTLLSRGLESEEFYERLWEFISLSSLLSGSAERSFSLFMVLCDPRLPYIKLSMVSVSDDRFDELVDSHEDELRLLFYVSRYPFVKKTDEASAVLSIVNSCNEEDCRAVLLAYYLQHVREGNE